MEKIRIYIYSPKIEKDKKLSLLDQSVELYS